MMRDVMVKRNQQRIENIKSQIFIPIKRVFFATRERIATLQVIKISRDIENSLKLGLFYLQQS